MKLRVVSNNAPPPPPKLHWIRERIRPVIALVTIAAVAVGIWLLSDWFSEPVSVAYLRQQSASFTKCEKDLIRYETRPITRYSLYTIRSVCESAGRQEKTVEAQQDALRNAM